MGYMCGCLLFVLFKLSVSVAVNGKYDYRKPLLLTPYLLNGQIKKAQDLSKVYINGLNSYSGFFTTDDNCKNNLFFWFYTAENNWENVPVLLWLNGGPGSSSLYGLFVEIGPFNFFKTGIVNNSLPWTKNFNIIFIDQPVGTGFSYSGKNCLPKTLAEVTKNLYSAVTQFFQLFPLLQKNKFFLTGESFAGHYLPALAEEIDKRSEKAVVKINLLGLFIGNALLDFRCNDASDMFYELGIIDDNTRQKVKELRKQVILAVNNKEYSKATILGLRSNSILNKYIPSPYNILYDPDEPILKNDFQFFVRMFKTRTAIHVGNTTFKTYNAEVLKALNQEISITIAPSLEYLLNTKKYIVTFYTGQLDTMCSVSSVSCALRSLQWQGSQEYLNSTRYPWYVTNADGTYYFLAGWYNQGGNLTEIIVRKCGHIAPADQPGYVFALLKGVTEGTF